MISIETKFYNNEKELLDALASGAIDSANSITPKNAAFLKINGKLDDKKIETAPLPRTFAVFFNQNQNKALSYKEVRQALLILTDKKQIVSDVLEGFGTPVDGVLPPSLLPPSSTANQTADLSVQDRITQAQKLLTTNGWVWNTTTNQYEKKVKKDVIPLAFSLSTSDAPELKATADLLKADWAKAGITVDVKVFEAGELTANVIGPRRYDALLYGEVIDRGLDFYAFWHSSQRKDPGLNIALYTNSKADTLLENGRATTNEEDRLNTYIAFSKEIDNDIPAIFLYAPSFIYITPKNLQGVVLGEIPTPSERFLGVNTWYLETDNVWRIFARH
jgi:ABC-type transport system substrate-binding protein